MATRKSNDVKMSQKLSDSLDLFRSFADAVLLVDQQNQILFLNAAAETLFGYEHEELVGENLEILIPQRFRPNHIEHINTFRAAGDSKILNNRPDLFALHRNGTDIPISVSLSPLGSDNEYDVIAIIRDASNFTDIIEKESTRAYTDPLTGLGNRLSLTKAINENLQNKDTPFSLLFIDLDQFKAVNDTLGHRSGDEVLGIIAKRMSTISKNSDTLARFGGDEFVIVLNGISSVDISNRVAMKLHATITQPIRLDNETLSIGVSIGCARFPVDGKTEEQLLDRADKAMFKAKRAGIPFFAYSQHI